MINFNVLAVRTLQSLEETTSVEERIAFLEEAYRRVCEYGQSATEQDVGVREQDDNVIPFDPTVH